MDHRALSAGTTQRFVLLLVLFLVSGVQLAGEVVRDPHFPGMHAHSEASVGCLLAAGVSPSASGMALFHTYAALNVCLARYGWNPPWWIPYAITAGLVAVIGLVYLLLAAGRRRVVPVTDVDPGGELAVELGQLTATAGLSLPLDRFVMDPTATTANAVAFGLPRRHTVCLHGALVARFWSDPVGFRTVVLHELAHIKNRDVGLTYVTRAAWRVYLIALLLPAAVSGVWLLVSDWISGTAAQSVFWPPVRALELKSLVVTAFIVLLVYLARADVMRARETYADLDASAWGARTAAFASEEKLPGPLAAFWQLWRTHTGQRQRAEVLTDATAVLRVSSLQMFLTGAAAVVVLYQFQGDLSPGGGATGGLQYWPGILAAALIASVAGVALWRAVAYTAGPAPSGLRAGLWLGIGLLAGDLMEGTASVYRWLPNRPVFLLALVLFATVATAWITQVAAYSISAWQGRVRGLVMVAGLAVIWAAVAIWLIWWYNQGYLLALGMPLTSHAAFQILLSRLPGPVIPGHHGVLVAITAVIALAVYQWLFAAAAALLWVVPLLISAHRTPAGSPRLRSALLAGLSGGAVCWTGAIVSMAYLHSWPIPAHQRFGSYWLIFMGCLVACVVAGMVAAAVAAALVKGGSRFLAALVAAGTASLAGLAGAYLFVSGDGCVAPLDTMTNTCAWRPVTGWAFVQAFGTLALAIGSVAAATAALLVLAAAAAATRWRAGTGPVTPDPVRPTVQARSGPRAWLGSLPAKRIVIVALTAMAVTLLTVTTSIPGGLATETTTPTASAMSQLSQVASASTYSAFTPATDVMIAAWLHYGGLQVSTGISDGFTRLTDAFDQSVATMKHEGNNVTAAEFRAAEAQTAAACAAIRRAAQSAEAYFPVPDPPLQLQWRSGLTGLSVDAKGCAEGVRKASQTQLLASLKSMIRAGENLTQVMTRLRSEASHFCGQHNSAQAGCRAAPSQPTTPAGNPAHDSGLAH